jgi:hypothetical protein
VDYATDPGEKPKNKIDPEVVGHFVAIFHVHGSRRDENA